MSNKLISVIIPAFNAEMTIQNSIRSVISQDYQGIELIVIDDGSSDKTISKVWEMRTECNKKGIKIQLVAQKNSGVSRARNRGVKEARGEYIAFLDADDQWLPEKLSKHAQHLDDNSQLGLSFARVNFMSLEGDCIKPSGILSASISAEDCLSANPTISPSNWVLRKSVFSKIQGFDATMTHAEDQDFLIRLLQETEFQVQSLDDVLVNYATTIDGLSSNIDAMYAGWLKLMETMQNGRPTNEPAQPLQKYPNYRTLQQQYCLYLTRRSMQTKQSSLKAWRYFFKSMLSSPKCFICNPKQPIHLCLGLSFFSIKQLAAAINNTNFVSKNSDGQVVENEEVKNA